MKSGQGTIERPPVSLHDKAPREGGPYAEKTGQGTPRSTLPTPSPPKQACSDCGTTEGRTTPTYWGGPLCHSCGDAAMAAFDVSGWPRPWWEIEAPPHLMALGSTAVCRTLGGLGAHCEANGITQVWIHETGLEALGFPARGGEGHPFLEAAGPWHTSAKAPVLSGYSKWWRPGGFGFTIHIPAYENSSAFAGAESAGQLLCWVAWYERATRGRATWTGGGSITSERWIREHFASRRRSDLAVTQLPPPMGRGREARWYWSRPATAKEAKLPFLHALDLNLAYAAVAGSLQLPVGECEHREFPVTFDKALPGLWLIEPWNYVTNGGEALAQLPRPWADDARRDLPGPHWVTTPTAERCYQLGIEPLEAWVWPEHHAYLRGWYEMVRDARAEVLDVGGAPLAAVKEISRRGVGRLASPNRSRDHLSDPLYQPYWAWAVIAECRARLHRRLAGLERAPVAIDTDGVYFLSASPTPEAMAARLGLPLGEGLGQFRGAGTAPAAEALPYLGVGPGGRAGIDTLRKLVK